jgi:hypothetical protein
MAVTFTDAVTGAGIRPLRVMASQGDIKVAFKKVTFDSNYISGGETCDLAGECGMSEVLFAIPTVALCGGDSHGSVNGLGFRMAYYNPSTAKVYMLDTAASAECVCGAAGGENYTVTFMVIGF